MILMKKVSLKKVILVINLKFKIFNFILEVILEQLSGLNIKLILK